MALRSALPLGRRALAAVHRSATRAPRLKQVIAGVSIVGAILATRVAAAGEVPAWQRDNVLAWCIVPYDAKKRSPDQRGEMLAQLGIKRFAYDYRAEHIPTFDREVEVMQQRGIEVTAWWFPQKLDTDARLILDVIRRHGIHPALWVTGGGEPVKTPAEQRARVAAEVARLRPIVEAARPLGCKVALYNHERWFGDPDNQLAVLEGLRREGCDDVGLVYNFHHAHDHVRTFAMMWPRIAPHVVAVNLSGIRVGGEKILYLGEGDQELRVLGIIRDSGWRGQYGVLCHRTDVDAADALRRNLAAYDRLLAQIDARGVAR